MSLEARLLATLRQYSPVRIRVSHPDGEREVAVPTRRRKWAQVIAAIQAKPWSTVEMLDAKGAILGYVENTDPATELETITGPGSANVTEAHRIVELVVKAQRDAMSFRDQEISHVLKAQGDVVRELTAGVRALSALYQEQVKTASEVAAMRVEAAHAEGGDQQIKQLIEAMPVIVQALPILKGLLNGSGGS